MYTVHVAPAPGALQRAIDRLPMDGKPVTLLLASGVYEEKVTLRRPNTTLQAEDYAVIRWHDDAFTILQDGMKRGTFRSYTMLVDAEHVTLRGLTIENTGAFPRQEKGQCVALYADGDHFLCEDCVLKSHQDTLFTAPLPPKEVEKNGFIGPGQHKPRTPQRHVYRRCRIHGDVDFIFGGAAAWFEACDIIYDDGSLDAAGTGFCTAASTPQGQKYGYVFHNCFFGSVGEEKGTVLLGRPWREYAKTILLNCWIGAHIAPAGWDDWGKAVFHQEGLYAEHGCTGPGADLSARCDFCRQLTDEEAAAITLEDFLNTPV